MAFRHAPVRRSRPQHSYDPLVPSTHRCARRLAPSMNLNPHAIEAGDPPTCQTQGGRIEQTSELRYDGVSSRIPTPQLLALIYIGTRKIATAKQYRSKKTTQCSPRTTLLEPGSDPITTLVSPVVGHPDFGLNSCSTLRSFPFGSSSVVFKSRSVLASGSSYPFVSQLDLTTGESPLFAPCSAGQMTHDKKEIDKALYTWFYEYT